MCYINWQLHMDKSTAGQYCKKLIKYNEIHAIQEFTCANQWVNKMIIDGSSIYVIVTNEMGQKSLSLCDLYKYNLDGDL